MSENRIRERKKVPPPKKERKTTIRLVLLPLPPSLSSSSLKGLRGLRKPQLDGDLRRIRSGGGTGVCVYYCHDLDRSHAINDETKKKILFPQKCELLHAFPDPPLRCPVGRLFCHRQACYPADVCCREENRDRLAAPLVGEQLRDLGAIPPSG